MQLNWSPILGDEMSGLGLSPSQVHFVLFLDKTLNLTVPLFTQVYKWGTSKVNAEGSSAMDQHPIQGRVEILLVTEARLNSGCVLTLYLPRWDKGIAFFCDHNFFW